MSDNLFSLRLFVRVARTGSISEAARELAVPQPSASRALAALEKELGVSLLTRSTRAVMLTEAGADYLARVEPLLDALDEARRVVRGTDELSGALRVAMAPSFGLRVVMPLLPAFLARHPALRVNLIMDDKRQDLLRDGVDVAVRFGPLGDSNATARRLGFNAHVLVAAPAYLRRAGTPQAPCDIKGHQIIIGPVGAAQSALTLERGGQSLTVKVEARVRTNLNEGAVAAAVAGLGLLSTGLLSCRAELASGALVRVLPDWSMSGVEFHAVFPAGRASKASARALVDYLAAELSRVGECAGIPER